MRTTRALVPAAGLAALLAACAGSNPVSPKFDQAPRFNVEEVAVKPPDERGSWRH